MDMVLERSSNKLTEKKGESAAHDMGGASRSDGDLVLQGQIDTEPSGGQSRQVRSIQPASSKAAPVDSIALSDYLETIKMFVALLENNRAYLRGHSVLMARICRRCASGWVSLRASPTA